MECSFLHLLSLDGKPLANPPPAMTRAEKLVYLAARTRDEEMTPRTREDVKRVRENSGCQLLGHSL